MRHKLLILLTMGVLLLGVGLKKLYAGCAYTTGNLDGTLVVCQVDPSGEDCQALNPNSVCEVDNCGPPCYGGSGGEVGTCVLEWNLCGDVFFPCRHVSCG